jgi:uncharacterized membrane protein
MMRREALREYVAGSLWVLPGFAALIALIIGFTMSQINIGPDSPLAPLAFQGTADDARALLMAVTGTVITVIALVLGLTVVALQLSSTQFSPRLLRNFLRDRANQIVLSIFVATFVYSAAGLYTVGVESGTRVEEYPRLAVTGSLVLLFASLALVVYFADHLAHSIQIDAITRRVEHNTLITVRHYLPGGEQDAPSPPEWAVPFVSRRSGYVQTVHPEEILPLAAGHGVTVRLKQRPGEHVVAGTTLAWVWRTSPDDPAPDPEAFRQVIDLAVNIGFERTLQQDAALGIRQLVDASCKALSPAINDPYTAVQSIDHVSVIFCALAVRPLGANIVRSSNGSAVIVPGRRFGNYLSVMCGLIRRYGAREPTVMVALLRLLEHVAVVAPDKPDRLAAVEEQASLILTDAEREISQPADVVQVREAFDSVQKALVQAGRTPSLRRAAS